MTSKRNLFWDEYGLTGLGLGALILLVIVSIFGVGLGGYTVTTYPVDVGNCRAAGGKWINGVLGGCVYPKGEDLRVKIEGQR